MKYALFILAAVLLSTGAMANEIPIKFCLKDFDWVKFRLLPVADKTVVLGNCVDVPVTCKTGADGCCLIEKRQSPDYCKGSGRNLCQWFVLDHHGNADYTFHPDHHTLARKQATWPYNYVSVTPNAYSCCKCNGAPLCPWTIYKDAKYMQCPENGLINTSFMSGPFTVTFTKI